MRGVPEFNAPAFDAAAAKLRAEGHEVFNPAENDRALYGDDVFTGNTSGDLNLTSINRREVFEADLTWICRHADAVALLRGWVRSKGARAEQAVAVALGLKIITL
jgi:hypothetical protein